jgi:pantetheine-phosphate adenylyltransferase
LTIAVYPGTFDPVTNGHMDIACRAAALFDKLIIAVYDTPPKHLLFTTEERVELFREAVKSAKNIEVRPYKGLTIDYARQVGARVIIRGLGMSSDFEREFEMALMNKKLAPELELFCLMSSLDYQFLSSSLLKEVAQLGGDIDNLVPAGVPKALKKKFALK